MTRPAPINSRWRFSFRTLLILLLVVPPLLGVAWSLLPSVRAAWLDWTTPPAPPVVVIDELIGNAWEEEGEEKENDDLLFGEPIPNE